MSDIDRDDLPSISIRRPVMVLVANLLIVLAGRITSYNVCYTKLLRCARPHDAIGSAT